MIADEARAIHLDGGVAGVLTVGGPFSREEIELARAIAQLHPSACEPLDAGLIFGALPLLREAKYRMRLGHRVDPRAIATSVENDPVAVWSLSRFNRAERDFIDSIVELAIELWSIPERN